MDKTTTMKKPSWYTDEYDTGWNRVKAAFANDWEQTKHDLGSKTAQDLNQNANDTVKQAVGTEETFQRHEPAFRFGYAAQRNYQSKFPKWNNDLESSLRTDYGSDFDRDRDSIRRAYEYQYDRGTDAKTGKRDEIRNN